MNPQRYFLILTILLAMLLAGCGGSGADPGTATQATPVIEVTEPGAPVATDTPQPSSTPAPTGTSRPTETPLPTETPRPTEPPLPTLTPTPEGLTEAQLAELRPNEIGWVLVLEYHTIEPGEDATYNRTPETFRADLEWLYENNYYPVTFRDLAAGALDVPAGKAPVVLTFDDSSIGQFRMLEDGTVDPSSGMGILLDFSEAHPDFPPVTTFFPLLDVDVDSRILWGQPEFVEEKLAMIIELGGEVGSHTVTHNRLDQLGPDEIQWQLGESQHRLEELIGNGYRVSSLSLPMGLYPADETLIHSGEVDGVPYEYLAAAEVGGGASYSPYSRFFDPYHIARAQAAIGYIENIFHNLSRRPTLKYISDGDPTTLTVPTEATLDPEQQGDLDEAMWGDMKIVRYDRPMTE